MQPSFSLLLRDVFHKIDMLILDIPPRLEPNVCMTRNRLYVVRPVLEPIGLMVFLEHHLDITVVRPFESALFWDNRCVQGNNSGVEVLDQLLLKLDHWIEERVYLNHRIIVSLPVQVEFFLGFRSVLVFLDS